MAKKKQTSATKKAKLIADQAVALADYAAKALVAAEQLRIKTKAVEHFPLDADERAVVAELPALAANLKKKLAKEDGSFTVEKTKLDQHPAVTAAVPGRLVLIGCHRETGLEERTTRNIVVTARLDDGRSA